MFYRKYKNAKFNQNYENYKSFNSNFIIFLILFSTLLVLPLDQFQLLLSLLSKLKLALLKKYFVFSILTITR